MERWVVTGISGSGRLDLLNELQKHAENIKKKIVVHDIGEHLRKVGEKHKVPTLDGLVLDMDRTQLRLLRALAIKEIEKIIDSERGAELHLIRVTATFRWKGRLIPGISFREIKDINPDGLINLVNYVKDICDANLLNPKWDAHTVPTIQETQEWMMEEEYVSELFAEVLDKPLFIVSRSHNISNLADLFFSNKKKIYLSYPITAVLESDPKLLKKVQGPILQELEDLFVVFNPYSIKDMPLLYRDDEEQLPELMDQITSKAKEFIKSRTIERDFQFIDQSDAVVVFYLTDKVSPGVLAEIYYAHRNQKPVYMIFPGKKSPFIEDAVSFIEEDIESLMEKLREFAERN